MHLWGFTHAVKLSSCCNGFQGHLEGEAGLSSAQDGESRCYFLDKGSSDNLSQSRGGVVALQQQEEGWKNTQGGTRFFRKFWKKKMFFFVTECH